MKTLASNKINLAGEVAGRDYLPAFCTVDKSLRSNFVVLFCPNYWTIVAMVMIAVILTISESSPVRIECSPPRKLADGSIEGR